MIAERPLLIDIDARQWINLLSLFARPRDPLPSLLVCLLDGERCLKAWHSRKGVLWGFQFPGMSHLEEARQAAAADYVLCLPRGALQEIFYHAQSAVLTGENYAKQMLAMARAIQDSLAEVAVWHPAKPIDLRLPDYASTAARLDKWWPDGRTLGFFVFDGKEVFTSAILGKDNHEVNLFTTLDAFGMSQQSLDWREGHKTLAELIAQTFSPLHTSLFIELPTFREMLAGSKPLSFLRLAEKRGRALITPKPWRLRLLLWAARVFKRL
ncbi:MAG: hypothetical protein GX444_16455 [Myxococcales bacterium]|nr:hypothetical protein [Myxococcales bacterium]